MPLTPSQKAHFAQHVDLYGHDYYLREDIRDAERGRLMDRSTGEKVGKLPAALTRAWKRYLSTRDVLEHAALRTGSPAQRAWFAEYIGLEGFDNLFSAYVGPDTIEDVIGSPPSKQLLDAWDSFLRARLELDMLTGTYHSSDPYPPAMVREYRAKKKSSKKKNSKKKNSKKKSSKKKKKKAPSTSPRAAWESLNEISKRAKTTAKKPRKGWGDRKGLGPLWRSFFGLDR